MATFDAYNSDNFHSGHAILIKKSNRKYIKRFAKEKDAMRQAFKDLDKDMPLDF